MTIQKTIPAGCSYVIPQIGTEIRVLEDGGDVHVSIDEDHNGQLTIQVGETGRVYILGVVFTK